jgi:glucoamylase
MCSFPANQVPKVLDVIPPAGVSEATELNPLFGPVQLQGVAMQP